MAVPSGCWGRKPITETASLNPFAHLLRRPALALKNLIDHLFAIDGCCNVDRLCLFLVQDALQCVVILHNQLKYNKFKRWEIAARSHKWVSAIARMPPAARSLNLRLLPDCCATANGCFGPARYLVDCFR